MQTPQLGYSPPRKTYRENILAAQVQRNFPRMTPAILHSLVKIKKTNPNNGTKDDSLNPKDEVDAYFMQLVTLTNIPDVEI